MARSQWSGGDAYEPYVGRWSRKIAAEFLTWLAVPAHSRWIDVGCGTGALTEVILSQADPESVLGVEPSEGYRTVAVETVKDPRARFQDGSAEAVPASDGSHDVLVSGLVLNFVPDPVAALREFTRVVRPGGIVAAYVWDYAGRIELMRYFWDAVVTLWPEDRAKDEGVRFPICQPNPLEGLWRDAGLADCQVEAIDVPTVFVDFDDYWSPFLGGQFPAPDYAMSLTEKDRGRLKEHLSGAVPVQSDGTIPMIARAWGVKGTRAAT